MDCNFIFTTSLTPFGLIQLDSKNDIFVCQALYIRISRFRYLKKIIDYRLENVSHLMRWDISSAFDVPFCHEKETFLKV